MVKGSIAYENWKAAIRGVSSKGALEFPLFTDAHITGGIAEGCGPHQLINTVPPPSTMLQPAVVLRLEYHLDEDPSDRNMDKTNIERYHGGWLNDEIAALISLCLGIRLKAGGCTRRFDVDEDPKGRPQAFEAHKNPILLKPTGYTPILPRALGTHCLNDASSLLSKFPDLPPLGAVALIRGARLYQDALWIAESEPALAWVMLVSALEAAAGYWRAAKESPVERLRASKPKLVEQLTQIGGEDLVSEVASQIADSLGATRKFMDFILTFLPAPPQERPPAWNQLSWGRKDMEKSLRKIYDWRSRALHGGIPFPLPMCDPPWLFDNVVGEIPMGLATGTQSAVWVAEDTPMLLHTFEYIARHVLLSWWESMLPVNDEEKSQLSQPAAAATEVHICDMGSEGDTTHGTEIV